MNAVKQEQEDKINELKKEVAALKARVAELERVVNARLLPPGARLPNVVDLTK